MTGKKKKLTILVDENVIQRAKDSGLNLSIIAEKAYLKAIKAIDNLFEDNKPESSSVYEKWWAEQGSNLRPSPRQGDVIPLDHPPNREIREANDGLKFIGYGTRPNHS